MDWTVSERKTPRAKNPDGTQKAFEPTPRDRSQVKTLAGFGLTEMNIAKLIGISDVTLRKYFREELDTGHLKANAAVARSLFRKATGNGTGSITAAIFWMKCRAGWREAPQEIDMTVNDKTERTADERARALALMVAKRGVDGERRTH